MSDAWKEAFDKLEKLGKTQVEEIEAIYKKEIDRLKARLEVYEGITPPKEKP